MIETRHALLSDTDALQRLLLDAGHPDTSDFLRSRLTQLLLQPQTEVLVAEDEGELHGLLHIEVTTELTQPTNRCTIRLLVVSDSATFPQTTRDALLAAGEAFARSRACDGLGPKRRTFTH